uniref:P-type domain-containing protein n=1 Tax=Gouania willdenowi TaxID=441366 RepID=A0A8C5DGE6_GOUWI
LPHSWSGRASESSSELKVVCSENDCAVSIGERVSCGYHLSSTECIKKGCCMDASTYGCYYPLDGKASDSGSLFEFV